ncbi:HAD family hydrolase [Lacticaseibacillus nasuensis]|uniref:HAD family hydrolase n=1 Tax=Lacticaseibacillus nasuensis TaxID=944671 RepID=UPI002245DDFA|nr:HAD family hydrolase [Lacticaseibacillus nasuensis]MCX2454885.1 HAD family hydrolase [Lacticaseibacillus nasuensis]
MPDLAQVRLIAADMDHTLLTEASQLPPHFDQLLTRLHQAGIQFVPASGRPLYTLTEMFAASAAELAFVSDNGAVVAAHNRVIDTTLLATAAYQDMVRHTLAHTDGIPMLCAVSGAIAPTESAEYDDVFREFYHQLDYVADLGNEIADVDKVTVYLPQGDSQRVYDEVLAPRYGDDYSVSVSGDVWIDLMPRDIDKGHGLRVLGEHLGIAPAEMLAIGDNYNDAEMLQTVGYSYVVANANPGVRQYAKYATASNEDYGVSQVIEAVLVAHNE